MKVTPGYSTQAARQGFVVTQILSWGPIPENHAWAVYTAARKWTFTNLRWTMTPTQFPSFRFWRRRVTPP